MRNVTWSARSKSVASLREHPSYWAGLCLTPSYSSIHQDVPLHSLEQFQELAPQEARTQDVLDNPHQLMLNRLSFELAERQRYACLIEIPRPPVYSASHRLDLLHKELLVQKDDLLKQGRIKSATVESVKSQIDTLMKVHLASASYLPVLSPPNFPFSGRNRDSEKGGRINTAIATLSCHDACP